MEFHHKDLNDSTFGRAVIQIFSLFAGSRRYPPHEKRASEEAQADAGVVDAVVFDIGGDEIGFGFELGAGVSHGDFGPAVDEHRHVIEGIAEYDGEERDDFVRKLIATEGTLGVFDPDVQLVGPEYYRKICDEQLAPLMFGLSTTILQDGTPEEVAEAVKSYVLGGKAGVTPFLMFLSNIAPATPAINVRTAVEATHVYGAPDATAETPFEPLGEVESFEDFLRGKIANNEEGYSFKWLEQSELSNLLDS